MDEFLAKLTPLFPRFAEELRQSKLDDLRRFDEPISSKDLIESLPAFRMPAFEDYRLLLDVASGLWIVDDCFRIYPAPVPLPEFANVELSQVLVDADIDLRRMVVIGDYNALRDGARLTAVSRYGLRLSTATSSSTRHRHRRLA